MMKRLMIPKACAVLALVPAAPALADTYTVTLTGNQYAASGAFHIDHGTGTFDDVINFTLPGEGSLAVFFSSIALGPDTDIDFTSASLNGIPLTISNSGSLSYGSSDVPGAPTASQALANGQPFASGFAGQLLISGVSGASASYAGTISFAGAVPEPASWGMLLVGLGMIGGVMRTRARVSRVTYA